MNSPAGKPEVLHAPLFPLKASPIASHANGRLLCAALLRSTSPNPEFLSKAVPRVIQTGAAESGKHQPVRSRTDVLAAAAFG